MALIPQSVTNASSYAVKFLDMVDLSGDAISIAAGATLDLLTVSTPEDIARSQHLSRLVTLGVLTVNSSFGSREFYYDSAASVGGAASEALTITGLAVGDQILAVSQRVAGANGTALTSFGAAGANSLTVGWTADPGAGAIVRVYVRR